MAIALLGLLLFPATAATGFDRHHGAWTRLLEHHVTWVREGHASRVDYARLLKDRRDLDNYLAGLSAVSPAQFARWKEHDRLAFLINAYNAFTVNLILTAYPGIDSIRDLGGFLSSPWDKAFFTLLGQPRSLNDLEHKMIRKQFDEPRVHFALNCASIGCPALRNEAYVGDRLEAQLEDAMTRFLSDRLCNHYDADTGELAVSAIFAWYADDFRSTALGLRGVRDLLAHHAALLAGTSEGRRQLQQGAGRLRYLPYDWRLNDVVTPD